MEALPVFDALQNQKVGGTGRQLDVGGPDDRPAVEVRGDLRVIGLGHAGDLLGLQDAAHPAEIHLQDRRAAGLQQPMEVVLGGQPLAGGDGDRRGPRHLGHLVGGVGRHRLLQPQGIGGLQPSRQPDGAGRGHLAVRSEQQVSAGAHRLAKRAGEPLAKVQRLQRKLSAVEGGVGAGGVELQRRIAARQILLRPLGGQVRVMVDVGPIAGPRIDVGVGAQALVHLAAQELVDRLARRLADDVPAGHLQRAEHAHKGQVGMLGEAAGIDAPPHRFDVMRVMTDRIPSEHILDHLGDQMRRERDAVGFADA